MLDTPPSPPSATPSSVLWIFDRAHTARTPDSVEIALLVLTITLALELNRDDEQFMAPQRSRHSGGSDRRLCSVHRRGGAQMVLLGHRHSTGGRTGPVHAFLGNTDRLHRRGSNRSGHGIVMACATQAFARISRLVNVKQPGDSIEENTAPVD